MERKHYYGIDWLRVIACLGIVMMHMLSKGNNDYNVTGFIAERMIPSFTNFVFLFMTISAFGLCVGYYEKVKSGKINWSDFYKKRYIKVLPFFAVVVLADIVFKHNITALVEAVPNLTLTRGFFPNSISQIGVAWFLGVIFVFYAIFPFFCCLISSKKSAWGFFAVSILLSFIVEKFYGIGRTNIIYCLPFFVAGGLIYLYRDKIQKIRWHWMIPVLVISIIAYYLIGGNTFTYLWMSIVLLLQAVVIRGGYNRFISLLSGISMEIYLSHMVMFRVIEKLRLNTRFGDEWAQYLITVILTFICAVCFSILVKKVIELIGEKLVKNNESIND